MRSTILLTILAIVALSLAEDTDQAKDTKSQEPGKESGNESGNESGKESGNESGKEETYTDRFDNINVDEIVANRRLLVPYLKCALDKGRCTPEGKELKIHIQDAMQTACKKCTEKQKTGARQVVNHIKEKEPLYWEELLAKYDPKNELKPIYEPFLAGKDK